MLSFCVVVATRRGLGPVQECVVVFSWPIKGKLIITPTQFACMLLCHPIRFVHAFMCAHVLPTQYIHFSKFAGIGKIGHGYINQGIDVIATNMFFNTCTLFSSVYNRREYIQIVGRLAEHSMQSAVEEVQSLPDYATKGEVYYMYVVNIISVYCFTYSGSSPTPDMTLPPPHNRAMPFWKVANWVTNLNPCSFSAITVM